MRVQAPSIYQANGDELAEIVRRSPKDRHSERPHHADPDGRGSRHQLGHAHSMADIEQGDTAIFSITITNTGNGTTVLFWDLNTEGQQEWLLPLAGQLPNSC